MAEVRVTQSVLETLVAATPPARVTQSAVEVLVGVGLPARITQSVLEVLMGPAALTGPVLAGELDRRTLTTATGPLNATWTGSTSGNWTAGLVALKKT